MCSVGSMVHSFLKDILPKSKTGLKSIKVTLGQRLRSQTNILSFWMRNHQPCLQGVCATTHIKIDTDTILTDSFQTYISVPLWVCDGGNCGKVGVFVSVPV